MRGSSDYIQQYNTGFGNGSILSFVKFCGIAFLFSFFFPILASAQVEKTVEAYVGFRQGQSTLDLNYQDNRRQLSEFIEQYHYLCSDTTLALSAITVSGMASPEGSYQINQRMSAERTASVADYLRKTLGLDETKLVEQPIGIAWDNLASAISQLDGLQDATVLLDIIRSVEELESVDGNQIEKRKQELMALGGGKDWNKVVTQVFPRLRATNVKVCIYFKETEQPNKSVNPAAEAAELTREFLPTTNDSVAPVHAPFEEATPTEYKKITVAALRTNLLFPLLNVGVEVPVGNHWSVGADYYYPWLFRKDDHKDCFQLLFVSGEARYWFGKNRIKENRLTGHSVAAYGAWGYYDFESDWSGHQGDVVSAGADYVYAKPILKGRLHLEFQLALGYIHSMAQPYDVFNDGGNLIRRKGIKKKVNYFGPTKVGISLVLPLKVKKGGSR